ncbi:MAG: hypothetical protein PHI35_03705 [Victivallaceae bacterium]|nr:hypothetical protein [Victivallaceae bacterium]
MRQNIGQRKKRIILPLAVGSLLIVLATFGMRYIRTEPMSAEAIADKTEWTKHELAYALGRAPVVESNKEVRRRMWENIDNELKKYPEPERREIRREAFRCLVDNSIHQFRALPRDKRRKMVAEVMAKIEKEEKQSENRRKVNEASSEDERGMQKEMMTTVQTKLSADERTDLAPLIDKCFQTIRESGR